MGAIRFCLEKDFKDRKKEYKNAPKDSGGGLDLLGVRKKSRLPKRKIRESVLGAVGILPSRRNVDRKGEQNSARDVWDPLQKSHAI